MRKAALIVLILTLSVFLVSCNNDISTEHFQYGKKAIEIIDGYLDYTIDVDEAYAQLKKLEERSSALPQTEFNDKTHASNYDVETYVTFACHELFYLQMNGNNENLKELVDDRNEIAKTIGAKRRKGGSE